MTDPTFRAESLTITLGLLVDPDVLDAKPGDPGDAETPPKSSRQLLADEVALGVTLLAINADAFGLPKALDLDGLLAVQYVTVKEASA